MDDFDFIKTRTVACDRKKLCELMDDKKLTAKQLAATADLYVETVEKMIRGEGTYKSSFRAVAEALGVEPKKLLSDTADYLAATGAPATPGSKMRTIIIKLPDDVFGDADTIVFEIRKASRGQGDFIVGDDSKGSRIITVELEEEDATRVCTAFIMGDLVLHRVEEITLLSPPSIWTFVEQTKPEIIPWFPKNVDLWSYHEVRVRDKVANDLDLAIDDFVLRLKFSQQRIYQRLRTFCDNQYGLESQKHAISGKLPSSEEQTRREMQDLSDRAHQLEVAVLPAILEKLKRSHEDALAELQNLSDKTLQLHLSMIAILKGLPPSQQTLSPNPLIDNPSE